MIDERPPQLDAYRRKRDPDRTPEPFGGRRSGGVGLFVVQQHAARGLHYDVRLEMDGVLKSWAVPRGPSVRPEVKRLAVHVEDHPLEYADFEGVIPKDNYGAGAVIVWDHGRYRSAKPEDPLTQLARGLVEVELRGYKLRGRWTLARMGGTDKEWLLIRKAGQPIPSEEVTDRYVRSVRSGLTLDEMRDADAVRAALRARLRELAAPAREVSAEGQSIMLATLSDKAPEGPDWLFEVKYDGVRVLAERRAETVSLRGRSGQDVTSRYPEVVAALRALAFDRFLIDGEIVALDGGGVPSFQRLQARMGLTRPGDVARAMAAVPAEAVFFDCLALEGHDLRRLSLTARKACLVLELPSYVKTSGATGLHVLVPLAAQYTHEQARTLARLLATLVVETVPAIATLARPLGARAGKVYVDFGQNGHGRTIVAPFSVRPRPGATMSYPLHWRGITLRLDPTRFTIRTVPRRFARRADPLAPVLGPGIDMAAALVRMEARLPARGGATRPPEP